MDNEQFDAVSLATEVTAAWLANPHTRITAAEVPSFLVSVHDAVRKLASAEVPSPGSEAPEHKPAVTVRKSLQVVGRIISMIDGKPYASLTRHLKAHGLTPAEYRQRYGLKADYPMVSPEYSEARRRTAKRLGLGRKPGQTNSKAGGPTKAIKAAKKTITDALKSAREHLGGVIHRPDEAGPVSIVKGAASGYGDD